MTKQIIPYLPIDLVEPKEIVDAVRARRGGTLLNLDRMLLNSPALIRGWNAHLKEIRENLTLDDKYKEKQIFHCDGCGICRVGGRENFFHCDVCNCCLALFQKNNHVCIAQKLK